MNREIVFFKAGEFSHVNTSVGKFLRQRFPDNTLRTIDVSHSVLKAFSRSWLRALRETIAIYPRQIFRRRRKPTDFLLRTPAAFHAIRQWVVENIDPANTLFTLQTQSLFDCAVAGILHYVYTDQTCLVNRRYARAVDEELLDPRWLAVEKTVYESARVTFTTSKLAERSLIEDYAMDARRAQCVFSGANVSGAAAPSKRAFRGVVLFVGIDWARKGGPDLVEAFRQIAPKHPNATLRIVGCKSPLDDPRIESYGRLSLAQTERHFREADIFCMPSLQDPAAVALVEAQLHGLPVVTTNVGGSPDRLIDGETGWLVPVGDVAAIAAALDRLLSDPARCRAMGEAGSRFVRERFSWERVGTVIAERIRADLASP